MNLSQSFKLNLKKYFPSLVYAYLRKKNPYLKDRMKIIETLGINVILDVGANIGLYGHAMRHYNFKGKIISFEPQTEAFKIAEKLASSDGNWIAKKYGLGSENTSTYINLSENCVSSSILDNEKILNELNKGTTFVGKEQIEIKRIDSIINEFCSAEDNVFVKIDTQGYELEVINGCLGCLDRIKGFQLELSFFVLYKNEKTFVDMIGILDNLGYKLANIEPGWNDFKTGFAIEVDGIFVKK